jgi:hypothetical protein
LLFEASLGKQFMKPYLKNIQTKNSVGRLPQDVGTEFKPQNKRKKMWEKKNLIDILFVLYFKVYKLCPLNLPYDSISKYTDVH